MSASEYGFRDAELQSLPLRALNWFGARLAGMGLEAPALISEAIARAAQKAAKCNDFGGDSFREPLECFLESARALCTRSMPGMA